MFKACIFRWYAIFNTAPRPDCKTVKSLCNKGMFDKNGLSEKGFNIAKQLSDTEHNKTYTI